MPPTILPVLLLVALGTAFALLTRRVTKRLGRAASTFGRGDTAHDFIGRVYRVGCGIYSPSCSRGCPGRGSTPPPA